MREKVDIKDLSGFTSDNVPVHVSGSLFFRVRDSYDACFSVSDFQHNVRNIGTSAMRSVIGHFAVSKGYEYGELSLLTIASLCVQYDEVIGDRNKINTKLHEVIGGTIEVKPLRLYRKLHLLSLFVRTRNGESTAHDSRCRTFRPPIAMSRSSSSCRCKPNANDASRSLTPGR